MNKQDYITKYWADAQAACKGTVIFPLLALTESAIESGWGESYLTKEANNFFGIKSTPSWEAEGGKFVTKTTHEVSGGVNVLAPAKFRAYDTPQSCFENYVHFVTQPGYMAHGVGRADTPESQIVCIANAGYATDPLYAQKITAEMAILKPLI